MRLLLVAVWLWGSVASAQVQTFVSRSLRMEVTLARYQVIVDAPASLPEADVYAAAADLPLDASHVTSSRYYPGGIYDDTQETIRYEFAFATPLSQFRETVRKLETLEAGPPEGILRLDYEVSAEPSADAAAQAQAALLPVLLAEARARAEALARASRRTLGTMRSMQPIVTPAASVQVMLARSDRFSRTDGSALGSPESAVATISLAVAFDLQ